MLWSLLFISLTATVLCKIQVLAPNGITSQSSDYIHEDVKYTSDRAIDGNLTKCAHTELQNNNWWSIDLQDVYRIYAISIYNVYLASTDITGAKIYIGNSREKNGTTNPMCKEITDPTKDEWNDFIFDADVSGRYVTVFLPGFKYLVLCEVQIFGSRKESPFELIRESKTWEDALYHCRDNNMELASIVDNETQALAELEAMKANTPFVWLGLRYTCTLGFWFWVDGQRVEFKRWATDGKIEECDMSGAMERQEGRGWWRKSDNQMFNFICAKQRQSRFELIRENKTWEDALYHCRDNNMELASIVDEEAQALAELEAKKANTVFVWLGFRYNCTLLSWFWVDGQRVDYNRWDTECPPVGCDRRGAMKTREKYDWWSMSDNQKFNFICAKW